MLDVFNQFSSLCSTEQTIHVMKSIFPRQFGLANVFTPAGVRIEDRDRLRHGASREDEVYRRVAPQGDIKAQNGDRAPTKLPKRLRGEAMELVRRMRVYHARCPYKKLLQHYCPVEVSTPLP